MSTRAAIAVSLCGIVIGIAVYVTESAMPLWAFCVLPFIADSL